MFKTSLFPSKGNYTNSQMRDYLEKKLLGESYLSRYQQYAAGENNLVSKNFEGTQLQKTLQTMRQTIVDNVYNKQDVTMGTWWFGNMTLYINILKVSNRRVQIQQQSKPRTQRHRNDSKLLIIQIINSFISLGLSRHSK